MHQWHIPPTSSHCPNAMLPPRASCCQVVLFTKSYCPYSRRARETVEKLGVHPTIIELDKWDDGSSIQNELGKMTGASTVPREWAIAANHASEQCRCGRDIVLTAACCCCSMREAAVIMNTSAVNAVRHHRCRLLGTISILTPNPCTICAQGSSSAASSTEVLMTL